MLGLANLRDVAAEPAASLDSITGPKSPVEHVLSGVGKTTDARFGPWGSMLRDAANCDRRITYLH